MGNPTNVDGAQIPRSQLRMPLIRYVESELAKQGGKSRSVTDAMRTRIVRLATGHVGLRINLAKWLESQQAVANVEQFVGQVLRRLPEKVDLEFAAKLGSRKSISHAKDPNPIITAWDKTKPAEDPDRIARMRDSQPKLELSEGFGDKIAAIDLWRILGTLSGVRKRPSRRAEVTPGLPPSVHSVIETVDRDALVPKAAKGTKRASNYADAKEVARDLASKLHTAHKNGSIDTLRLDLGVSYRKATDRYQILKNLKSISEDVRDALPNRASSVRRIQIYFGSKLATVLVAD